MQQKRLLVDLDGTIARFHGEANYMERMFESGFFQNLEPFPNMVEGLRLFIQSNPGVQVFSCSAEVQSPYCRSEKDAWLDKYLPEIPKERRIYTEVGRSKADYLSGTNKQDYLLDDYNCGLHKFLYDGGSAIKCHNDINQKGMGAHGGERGYMWEGPMIHASDPPQLIASELAHLMGLEYDIQKAADACGIRHINDPKAKQGKGRFIMSIQEANGISYAVPALRSNNPWTIRFRNPFNALRWLNSDTLAYEYTLTTHDGHPLTASGYQLEAICQNAYGSGNFLFYMHADRTQLADDTKRAFDHRGDAMVGFISRHNPIGEEYDMVPFYDCASMSAQVERYEQEGEAYSVQWFIDPSHAERNRGVGEIQPTLSTILEDASRRAAQGRSDGTSGKGPIL